MLLSIFTSQILVPSVRCTSQQPLGLNLYQQILERLGDGVLLFDERGKILFANSGVKSWCQRLGNGDSMPDCVMGLCQNAPSDRSAVLESNVRLEDGTDLRLRIRWIPLGLSEGFLVTFEDISQIVPHRVLAEAKAYGFTERESEVWLLRSQGLSYKQIAARLYISEHTVKKHLRNARSKRDSSL